MAALVRFRNAVECVVFIFRMRSCPASSTWQIRTVPTLAVFLSLLFWGWVLGTIGVFLSVPLTMVLIIALHASPQTRPLAIMLGPDVSQPEIAEKARQDGEATAAANGMDD